MNKFLDLEGLKHFKDKLSASIKQSISKYKVGDIIVSGSQTETENTYLCNGRNLTVAAFPEYFHEVGFKYGINNNLNLGNSAYIAGTYTVRAALDYDENGVPNRRVLMRYNQLNDIRKTDGVWGSALNYTLPYSNEYIPLILGHTLLCIFTNQIAVLNQSGDQYAHGVTKVLNRTPNMNYFNIYNVDEYTAILAYAAWNGSKNTFNIAKIEFRSSSNFTVSEINDLYIFESSMNSIIYRLFKIDDILYYCFENAEENTIYGYNLINNNFVDEIPDYVIEMFEYNYNTYVTNRFQTAYTCYKTDSNTCYIKELCKEDTGWHLHEYQLPKNDPLYYVYKPYPSTTYNYGNNKLQATAIKVTPYPFIPFGKNVLFFCSSGNLKDSNGYSWDLNIGVINDKGICTIARLETGSNTSTMYNVSHFATGSQPFDGIISSVTSSNESWRIIYITPETVQVSIPKQYVPAETILTLIDSKGSQDASRTDIVQNTFWIKVK